MAKRDYTPTYRVEFRTNLCESLYQMKLQSSPWDCKRDGRPTADNAEKYRREMNQSFLPGGVNYHISESRNVIIHVNYVRIIRQSTNETVAEVKAPIFDFTH